MTVGVVDHQLGSFRPSVMRGRPWVLGRAPVPPGRVLRWGVGRVAGRLVSGGAGLEAVPGGDQVGRPGPAGRDLQDSSAGVGDQPGRGGQDPEAQRLGRGRGLAVESDVA